MKRAVLFLLIVLPPAVLSQHIVINEVMSSNQTALFDENGDASDWIELYNPGGEPANLSGYGLSDDPLDSLKWRFGNTVMPAGGYLIVFASDKNRHAAQLHTNFKISASGETLVLADSNGVILDRIAVPACATDISYARINDAGPAWGFQIPTPGVKNAGTTIAGWADSISLSHRGGFYPSPVAVSLLAGTSKIFYTLDGSRPDSTKTPYTGPIPIAATTVLKAMSTKDAYLPTRPITHTYFINVSTTLPVISLSASPYDLFDADSGIYTNYTKDWERPAHVEFFEDDKSPGFSEDCGINIHGAQSAEWAQKSFAVKFKQAYGRSTLEYPLFPDFRVTTFDSFVLRNSGNDWQYTHMRDALMQMLVKNLDIDYLEYRPATSFINGQYWGIYNIREKVSEHYVEHRYGADPDNIDMIENNMSVIHGDSLHYRRLLDFINTHDMSTPAAYSYLDSVIDLDECVLYFAAQAYYDNMDWPGTNLKYWRPRSPSGKWRWILFDLDFGFGLYAHGAWEDHIAFMFATTPTRYSNPPWATLLQRKLVENPVLRNRFINQIADLLNTNFKSSRVVNIINTMANHIASELVKHRARWNLTGENLTKLTTFALDRPAYLRTHVRNYFGCGNDGTVTIHATTGGSVRLNTLMLQGAALPFTGVYFQGNAIHVSAVPDPGYKFDGWSGAVTSQDDSLTLNVGSTTELTAAFSPDGSSAIGIVINEINYNSSAQFDAGDWIELYNGSKQNVDIGGWTFTDSDPTHLYTIPSGTTLGSDQYLVLAEDSVLFTSRFPDVKNYLSRMGFGFSGSGESMKLMNEAFLTIDSLEYDDQTPWPTEADGLGATLELVDPASDNTLGSNWKASAGHGSPGKKNSVTTSVDTESGSPIPASYALAQNYPNPFNPTTTIEYQIPTGGFVSLKVYDVLGQEVATLFEGERGPGRYSAAFSGQNCASGVYLYRLTANTFVESKRLLLMK
jgi:hypothetical protein